MPSISNMVLDCFARTQKTTLCRGEETGFDESCGKSLLRPPGSELRVTDLPLSSM